LGGGWRGATKRKYCITDMILTFDITILIIGKKTDENTRRESHLPEKNK
jgi:hypothetical protein